MVEVCAVAKRDLKAGETLDDYGMYMTYGEAVNVDEMSAGAILARGTGRGLQAGAQHREGRRHHLRRRRAAGESPGGSAAGRTISAFPRRNVARRVAQGCGLGSRSSKPQPALRHDQHLLIARQTHQLSPARNSAPSSPDQRHGVCTRPSREAADDRVRRRRLGLGENHRACSLGSLRSAGKVAPVPQVRRRERHRPSDAGYGRCADSAVLRTLRGPARPSDRRHRAARRHVARPIAA